MKENMKLFTDPFGKFQMITPIGYQYKNPGMERKEWEPHAFGGYDGTFGAFQISCKPVNAHIAQVIMNNMLKIQPASVPELIFTENFFDAGDTLSNIWMAAVEDHFVLATFIYGKKIRKKAIDELKQVKACLSSFKFIKPEFREIVLANRRYDLFMASTAAAIDLRNKALENGSFIELVILTANRIDALLRLAIVLTNQLENGSDEIDTGLLFQDDHDKIVMEHAIYKIALDRKIIDKALFDNLGQLYKERNKVVHRYIITDLRTEQVIDTVFRYYEIEDEIDKIIYDLEKRQYQTKVGINANVEPGTLKASGLERLKAAVKDKHGNIGWKRKEHIAGGKETINLT